MVRVKSLPPPPFFKFIDRSRLIHPLHHDGFYDNLEPPHTRSHRVPGRLISMAGTMTSSFNWINLTIITIRKLFAPPLHVSHLLASMTLAALMRFYYYNVPPCCLLPVSRTLSAGNMQRKEVRLIDS